MPLTPSKWPPHETTCVCAVSEEHAFHRTCTGCCGAGGDANQTSRLGKPRQWPAPGFRGARWTHLQSFGSLRSDVVPAPGGPGGAGGAAAAAAGKKASMQTQPTALHLRNAKHTDQLMPAPGGPGGAGGGAAAGAGQEGGSGRGQRRAGGRQQPAQARPLLGRRRACRQIRNRVMINAVARSPRRHGRVSLLTFSSQEAAGN